MNNTPVKELDFLTKLKKFIDNNYLKDFDEEIKLELDKAEFFISFNNWHRNNIELDSEDIFKNVVRKMFPTTEKIQIDNKDIVHNYTLNILGFKFTIHNNVKQVRFFAEIFKYSTKKAKESIAKKAKMQPEQYLPLDKELTKFPFDGINGRNLCFFKVTQYPDKITKLGKYSRRNFLQNMVDGKIVEYIFDGTNGTEEKIYEFKQKRHLLTHEQVQQDIFSVLYFKENVTNNNGGKKKRKTKSNRKRKSNRKTKNKR